MADVASSGERDGVPRGYGFPTPDFLGQGRESGVGWGGDVVAAGNVGSDTAYPPALVERGDELVDDNAVALGVADDQQGAWVVRDETADTVREVGTESSGQVRKHPCPLRVGGVAVRLEQDLGRDGGSVLAAVGGFECGVPVERDDALNDTSMDQSGESLVRGGRLSAAAAVEVGHLLLEPPPGRCRVLDGAPCRIPRGRVVADEQLRRLVGSGECGGEHRPGGRIGVDGVPQQRGETRAGRISGGEGQAGPDDGYGAQAEPAPQRRYTAVDVDARGTGSVDVREGAPFVRGKCAHTRYCRPPY